MSSPQKVLNCRYRYDPLDRLTSHTLSDTPERQRFYCKSRLATEIQGTLGHSIVQHDDLLLAQHQRQNGVLDTTLLATDLQRSVLHTLKNGRQPQPIAYSPYGHRPAESGLTSLLGFNGERPDPVTGHYLLGNGYRAFNPVLMRFNSPDSLSPFGEGGLNTYAFCNGDPINNTDPSGHRFISPFKASILSSHRESKFWVPYAWGQKKRAQIRRMRRQAEDIISDAQHTIFESDRTIANSALTQNHTSGSQLAQSAHKRLIPETEIFLPTQDLVARFSPLQQEAILQGLIPRQAAYAPLLNEIAAFNQSYKSPFLYKVDSMKISNTISIHQKAGYIEKMSSVVPEKAAKLIRKAEKLDKRYFQDIHRK